MTVARFTGDVRIAGNLAVDGTLPPYTRAALTQEADAVYPLDLCAFRVWDAPQTNLPGTAATDDLALQGTWASQAIKITSGDVKALGTTTRYARVQAALPVEYVPGGPVTLRLSAGMKTTIAATSATLDVEVRKSDKISGIGADICATAALSINSLTFADKDFSITPTGLDPGDTLDIRLTIVTVDAGSATTVEAVVAAADLLLAIKG